MSKNAVGATYSAPKHKSTLGGSHVDGNAMSKGVEDGLSSHMKLDVDSAVKPVSSDGSFPGFATERRTPRDSMGASKYGKKFNIER